ncbi:MAG: hypothetical protein WED09_02800 [Homoserinimonas sp.]
MKPTPASSEPIFKIDLGVYYARLLNHMSIRPDDDSRGVRLEHFTAQISAAYDTGKPITGLADYLGSELQAWDLSGDCSLHSDSTQVDYTLAPHFLVGVTSASAEGQHRGALVTVSILAIVDDAPHGDPCRQRAALDELQDILSSEFGAQKFEEPDLDWGTVTMLARSAVINELPEWATHLRKLGWDAEGSGDNSEENEG